MANYNALGVPPSALEHGGNEIMRAAIANGELVMSLKRAFDDPEDWGRLLAEVVKHVSQIYGTETAYNRADAVKRMLDAFAKEMEASDAPGKLAARN
jgi:hypothetical protein